jgi:hypothetical protein
VGELGSLPVHPTCHGRLAPFAELAVAHELFDVEKRQLVTSRKALEGSAAEHVAVIVDELAERAGRRQASKYG